MVSDDNRTNVLRDWEVLRLVNGVLSDRHFRRGVDPAVVMDREVLAPKLDVATRSVEENFADLDMPFKVPEPSLLAILWAGDISNMERRDPQSVNLSDDQDTADTCEIP